jgi:hypothetical protein
MLQVLRTNEWQMINNLVGPQDGSTSPIMQDHVINHATNMHALDKTTRVVGRVRAPQQLTIERCVDEIQSSCHVQRQGKCEVH